ncbi:MAG: sigma-70 family RNA polymerase sigma factor [Sedimentisphaerales bacterium]|nr:sigma-70 family RNA polymerase sigma factor [Sedimentisphaerales bacterium]
MTLENQKYHEESLHVIESAYNDYANELYKYALVILTDSEDANDAIQQVFIEILRKKKYLSIQSYKQYLLVAVRNKCYDIIKKRNHLNKLKADYSSMQFLEVVEECKDYEDERILVERAIRKLPIKQREIIYWKIYENKTFKEIGEIVEMSVNTVTSRYRYAMDKLKEYLEKIKI